MGNIFDTFNFLVASCQGEMCKTFCFEKRPTLLSISTNFVPSPPSGMSVIYAKGLASFGWLHRGKKFKTPTYVYVRR